MQELDPQTETQTEKSRLERIDQLERELARLRRMAQVADDAENAMLKAVLGSAAAEVNSRQKTWKQWQALRRKDPKAYEKASNKGLIAADLASMGRAKFYEEEA